MRYVGNIEEDGVCRVKIDAVDGNDPLFKVKNGENALAFYSHYYQPLPLVLRGYGAGNDVTAAGVFADLLRTLSWKLESDMVRVYAPASSANMSVGFDVLGAAVTPVDGSLLGDVVSVEAADQFSLNNLGRFANKLPSEPRENIVYQCWERFCRELGKTVPVAMTLEKICRLAPG